MNHAGWLGRHAGFLSHVSVDWFVGNTFVVFVWFGLVWLVGFGGRYSGEKRENEKEEDIG